MDTFFVETHQRAEMIEITEAVRQSLARSEITHGQGVIYCPHTTAGVTINESYDPDVVHDMLLWLERMVPRDQPGFRHGEGNSDSHIKATFVGNSVTVLVDEGKLILGRWQGIFFCEFDGPRERSVHVQWLGGPR